MLVGPNCLGVVDNHTATYLSSNAFRPGGVALLSQSGNLAIEMDRLFAARGLGISRFVSLGNQADVGLVELVTGLRGRPAPPRRSRCTSRTSATAAASSRPRLPRPTPARRSWCSLPERAAPARAAPSRTPAR